MSQREIKLRAWNNAEKKMVYSGEDDFYFLRFHKGDFPIALGCHNMGGDPDSEIPYGVIMQYTGITDKNGNEIYEGDILWHPSISTGDGPLRIVVKWERFVRGPVDDRDTTMDYCFGWIFDEDPEEMIVVGNIYQNPNLIK